MGTKTMYSNNITFIDTTDSRTLTVQLTSNYPTTQIYNPNINTYSPPWNNTNKLIITPTIYVDSASVNISNATVIWQRKDGNSSTLVTLSTTASGGQQVVNKGLQVSQNVLSSSQIITYICSVQYDGLTASAQITFNRSDMGKDGSGVSIKGTASSVTAVSGTNYYTINPGSGVVTDAQLGDGWLYNGDLYICSQLNGSSTTDYFINAGRIQGPAGDSAKNINLSATSQVFKISKTNVVSPATITVTGTAVNTSISSWQYSINGGSFSTSVPTGVTRSGNNVTINGTSFTGQTLSIKATDGTYSDILSVYKSIDGIDGTIGSDGEPAPIMFLTNENVTFNANSQGQIGATSISTNIVAYKGLTSIMPQIGSITGIVNGMSTALNTVTGSREQTLTITIASNSTLSGSNGYLTIPVSIPTYVQATSYASSTTYYSDVYGSALATQPTSSNFSNGTYYKIDTTAQSVTTNLKLYWNKIINASDAYTVILSNESHIVACDKDGNAISGELGSTGKAMCDIIVYKGSTQLIATSGTSPSSGQFSYAINTVVGGTAARSDNDTFYLNTATADSGYIPITIYLESNTLTATKRMSFSKSKTGASGINGINGTNGTNGINGTSASLVSITPSALYFKSTTGKDGTFTPEYIYLYPRFQTVTYSNWQYSLDGGSTWANASGANGLTIGTYNSIVNALRISRDSTLYSDTVTSISFKCISSTASIYDIVSIAKIYDVVDLEIGGRNLLLNSNAQNLSTTAYNCASYNLAEHVIAGETYTWTANITPSNNKKGLAIYFGGSTYIAGNWITGNPLIEGVYSKTFIATAEQAATTYVNVYCSNNQGAQGSTSITGTCTVNWMKLEKGNKPTTDWTPAPEDQVSKNHIITEINQTTEQIRIAANKIQLEGITTVNNNFVIDNNGNVSINGNINANTGSIAGFTINPTSLSCNIHEDYSWATAADETKIQQYILYGTALTDAEKEKYDINGDYMIGATDLLGIRRIRTGVDPNYANSRMSINPNSARDAILIEGIEGFKAGWKTRIGVGGFSGKFVTCDRVYADGVAASDSLSIGGTPISDFVVEQGTSGNWTYRKWNSGISECWGIVGYVDNITTAWGSVYEGPEHQVSYPSGLFISAPIVVMSAYGNGPSVLSVEQYITSNDNLANTTPRFYFTRGASRSSVTCYIQIISKGKWK